MKARIAPTPSGFLHLGNAFNFVKTWLETRRGHGTLRLRIDDLDGQRTRREYLEDIFRTLAWMGLDYDLGPRAVDEHLAHHSQALRRERYREALGWLLDRGLAHVCTCSRSLLQGAACACREKNLPFDDSRSVVRVSEGEGRVRLGNFVLWRREGIPAYQLASLIDDLDYEIDLIVRGEDLRDSTEAQLFLASLLGSAFGADRFSRATFVHHPLIPGPTGEKLSKSGRASALRERIERGEGAEGLYRELSPWLGLTRPAASLAEILNQN